MMITFGNHSEINKQTKKYWLDPGFLCDLILKEKSKQKKGEKSIEQQKTKTKTIDHRAISVSEWMNELGK